VGECLLAAMAEIAGPLWNDELAAAWAETYGAVSALMQQGAAAPVGA
jgi:hemoglobin-like flavoprotein